MTLPPRLGISTSSADGGIAPDALAKAVEERGFDWLLFDDHSYFQAELDPAVDLDPVFRARLPLIRDLFVVLAYAATATTTLTIGSGVALLPQRDTLHTAKAAATLATLSGNRIVLGVGVGWNLDEVRNHGADPSTRGAKLNEQLTALRALWANEDVEFHGDHVDFDSIVSSPRPSVPVPVYVGGSSRAALSRTVRLADGWLPLAATTAPDELALKRAWFAEQGRDDLGLAVSETPDDSDLAAAYLRAGAETVLFHLEPGGSTDVLHALDALAVTAGQVRSAS
jgi:probable F420-dependent oxidoreductase